MKFIADFHIHSRYSRAVSKDMDIPHIEYFARVKGIGVVGSGDILHPEWFREVKELLVPAEEGLFRNRASIERIEGAPEVKREGDIRFILSGEISNIYKRGGRVRKVHNLLLFPSFEEVEKFSKKLSLIGNLSSDGRPILGLDSKDLLEILLETSPSSILIPAHIWTPWFSILGSRSGFESVDECFDELTPYIYSVETGLSSDPKMNWRVSSLDRFTLISNSDAHSPSNLGREANIFDCELTYNGMIRALKEGRDGGFCGTIEFFPEEGKYHFDGHRKCGVRMSPEETKKNKGLCPVCKKPVVKGVMNRVIELSDRDEGMMPEKGLPYHRLIPLKEILSEIFDCGISSRMVEGAYRSLIRDIGAELDILLNTSCKTITEKIGERWAYLLAEALRRMRNGEVLIEEGFDGQYGKIRLFKPRERERLLFSPLFDIGQKIEDIEVLQEEEVSSFEDDSLSKEEEVTDKPILDPEQEEAIQCDSPLIVIRAGPGSGKTRTLISRIEKLIGEGVPSWSICAITFTNRAAIEMRERLSSRLGKDGEEVWVSTLHNFCLSILKEHSRGLGETSLRRIASDFELDEIWRGLKVDMKVREQISLLKGRLVTGREVLDENLKRIYLAYEAELQRLGLMDIDDTILLALRALVEDEVTRGWVISRWKEILIDEFQDLNPSQFAVIELLKRFGAHLFVIGDPDQAIYGFRGATSKFFEELERYPECRRYTLSKNYRSVVEVLEPCIELMKIDRSFMTTVRRGKGDAVWYNSMDEDEEAEFIVKEIDSLLGGTVFTSVDSRRDSRSEFAPSDIAILYRINAVSEPVEKALSRLNIPYQRLDHTKSSEKGGLRMIQAFLKEVDSALSSSPRQESIRFDGIDFPLPRESKQVKGKWLESSIDTMMKRGLLRWDETRALIRIIDDFRGDFPELVEYVSLLMDMDLYIRGVEAVSLLTIHSAKGLEFPVVFIYGCNDGIIPFYLFAQKDYDMEEERRVLYVGMTRAKDRLYLTSGRRRRMMGRVFDLPPSPFIMPMIGRSLRELKKEKRISGKGGDGQLKLF